MQSIDHAQIVASEPVDNGGKPDAPTAKPCGKGEKVRAMLRARLGEDIYTSWFAAMEFDNFDGRVVRATVPVKFLKSWIQSHYSDDLLECCAAEFSGAERVDLALRQKIKGQSIKEKG
jgi:chromosomal replication initiator protein